METSAGNCGTYHLADADLGTGGIAVATRIGDRDRLSGNLAKTTAHRARPGTLRHSFPMVSKLGSLAPAGNRVGAQFSGTPAAGVDDVGAEQVAEAGAGAGGVECRLR
ncbi:hypothetical protein ACLQ26_26415 [Micromonospora sp. DT43]|uniref:hypothetical protein n=1 Tax=Micromonospora sp. DT43 TaxID=3393440 RepID=UPI003CEDF36D